MVDRGKPGLHYYSLVCCCKFLKGDLVVRHPHHRPSDHSLDQLVEAMRQGNRIFDRKYPQGGPLLAAYDGLDLVANLGICRLPHGDYGVHTDADLVEKFRAVNERGKRGDRLLGVVFVQTPLTIMIGLSPSGHAGIFGSHIHVAAGLRCGDWSLAAA